MHVAHVGSGLQVPSEFGVAHGFHMARDYEACWEGGARSTQARAWTASGTSWVLMGWMADAEEVRMLMQVIKKCGLQVLTICLMFLVE